MRLCLIDDHALFRIGLQELLERRGLHVVGSTGDASLGVELVTQEQPDVVLLDMRMPNTTGVKVLMELKSRELSMPIVMLTTSSEEQDLVSSLQGGARGYLLKDMEPDELLKALEDIVKGATIVAPSLTGILAKVVQGDQAPESDKEALFSSLTPREREILCHLAEGQSNKVIARNLGIADGTVKLHVKAILRKLDVHSRVEAAVIAVQNSLCKKEILD
ncbi:MAG: response regulator [Methylococcales bacterium]|jgi:two-component system, NarL family, nitrate/nitrite response regulator NarL|nr:response regulator [Methylococcales bacterium]MBT7444134.1 response regulator [Methylococcales bacterium]